MTKARAIAWWRDFHLPQIKTTYESDGVPDYPARSESWSAYTDGLCKDGQITLKQYETWTAPRECGK